MLLYLKICVIISDATSFITDLTVRYFILFILMTGRLTIELIFYKEETVNFYSFVYIYSH